MPTVAHFSERMGKLNSNDIIMFQPFPEVSLSSSKNLINSSLSALFNGFPGGNCLFPASGEILWMISLNNEALPISDFLNSLGYRKGIGFVLHKLNHDKIN
jgi:hypothetical protein